MRSFIRWAGSKRTMLPILRQYWSGKQGRYIEPFCGSACLFFDIEPATSILGDLNGELILTFQQIRSATDQVLESLGRLPTGSEGFYRVRSLEPLSLPLAERAARFIYLNKYCFNGIYRTNRRGAFNVPYGPPVSGKGPDEALIRAAGRALARATLIHGDFQKTLDRAREGDFIYLDPPYCVDNRRVFREYLPGSFSLSDLERLRQQLLHLDEINAAFVVSYADCAEARDLLAPWQPRRARTRRHIAGFRGDRRHAYELIATNLTATPAEG